ncbi:MAG: phosphoglycerate kinase [Candidatus Aenigmatarchaeota archaeon]
MKTLQDVDLKEKKVLVRVDLNSTVKHGRVKLTPRIKEHAKTLDELCDKGCGVVALAHQGRPGRDDFTHLEEHAELLNQLLDRRIIFVRDITGKLAQKAIDELHEEDIILLDNVRMHEDELKDVSPEEHGKSGLVQTLSEHCDIYVNDAFSVCHRNQASITGFPQVMESVAGPLLEEDVEKVNHIEESEEPRHFILGGDKPEDAVEVMERMLEDGVANLVMLGGRIGEIFLEVNGHDLGAKSNDVGESKDKVNRLLEKYGDRIIMPKDLAYEKNGMREEVKVEDLPVSEEVLDIGTETAREFKDKLEEAETIVLNGPLGVFEKENFKKGTRKVLNKLKEMDRFILVGGGDTSHAVEDLGFDVEKDFTHVSLAGGAFVKALLGEELVGVEVLN